MRYSCSPSLVQPDSVMIRVKHREEGPPEPVVNRGKDSLVLDWFMIFMCVVIVINNTIICNMLKS